MKAKNILGIALLLAGCVVMAINCWQAFLFVVGVFAFIILVAWCFD
jgi:hypothetical protein